MKIAFFEYLIEKGAPVNARDSLGGSVLFYCLMYLGPSGFEKADQLFSHGADVNAKDRSGTPMLFSSRFQYPKCYEWLLRNGANLNGLNSEGIPFMQLADNNIRLQMALHILRECHRQRKKRERRMATTRLVLSVRRGAC